MCWGRHCGVRMDLMHAVEGLLPPASERRSWAFGSAPVARLFGGAEGVVKSVDYTDTP
jgi:hypothetical protein